MRLVVWVLVGWLGVSFWTAVGSRLSVGYAFPDAAIVTVCFLALRKEPIAVALVSLALGYLSGRAALAPVGVHEVALVASAIGVYILGGQLAASGAIFCALLSSAAVMGYHILLYILLLLGGDGAGFASWTTAALVPCAVLTGALAFVCYPFLAALDRRLAPVERVGGLQWD